MLDSESWSAKWIGWDKHDGSPEALHPEQRRLPARYLRHDFQTAKNVKRATAYVCGLGLFELRLNGKKMGDHMLDPGLTQYDKRALYVTFDISRELREGAYTVGVILGNGRYYAMRTHVPFLMQNFGFPKLLLQIEVEYEDGTRQTVWTNVSSMSGALGMRQVLLLNTTKRLWVGQNRKIFPTTATSHVSTSLVSGENAKIKNSPQPRGLLAEYPDQIYKTA